MQGMRVWVPEFGEHIGTTFDGSPALATGEHVFVAIGTQETAGMIASMSPEEAERLAGNLLTLASKARREQRNNKKTMGGTKNG